MASQRRFEGTVLEDVLERVRTEVGPDARIVGANRIRKGGIAGFFAKEGYEVVVDLPAGAPESWTQLPADPPAAAPASPRARDTIPASVLDLAEELNATERDRDVIDISDGRISTERSDFGDMLSRLTSALDEEEARFGALTLDDAPVSPNAVYRRVVLDDEADVDEPTAPTAPTARRAILAPLPEQLPPADPRLLALGLPAALVPSEAAGNDLRGALVQRLAQLPAPPPLPRTSGVIITVVGIGAAPIALAQQLGAELDVTPGHVMLASPDTVCDVSHPDDAAALRRSSRRRTEPTIVACSIGPGRAQLGWAHHILDALEPAVTWGVVDASCKPDDIAHRISLLGGVDVLALTGVADTVSPAAILELDVPVGRIGSNPATPAAWADLLLDRLER